MPKDDESIVVETPEAEAVAAAEPAATPAEKDPAANEAAASAPESEMPAAPAVLAEIDQLKAQNDQLKTQYEQLKAQMEPLKTERDQLVERLARLQAEFENARKRAERDRVSDREYATASLVEQFLPVVDNFELALKSNSSVEQLRSGVELIVKQMDDILRLIQVTPIPAVGEIFDPRLHEALGTVERDDMPDQSIAEEIRRGYRLRERLVRPALVRVVSNPKQTSE